MKFSVLIIAYIIWCFVEDSQANKNELDTDMTRPYVSVVKGIYMRPVESVIAYEGSIPISFVLKLPEIETPKNLNYDCTADEYLCELLRKNEKFANLLTKELQGKTVKFGSPSRRKRGLLDIVGEVDKFVFGLATQGDIHSLVVANNFIANREKELQDAVVENQSQLTTFVKNLTAYSVSLKETLEHDFDKINENIAHMSVSQSKNEASLAQLFSTNLRTQFLNYLSSVMDSAYSDCRNQLIPTSVLSPQVLTERLDKLERDLDVHGYKLAATINQLLKSKISDCWISETEVQVTVNVPFVKKGRNWIVSEVLNIPYQHLDSQCQVMEYSLYVAQDADLVVPIGKNLINHCNPQHGLCYVPQQTKNPSSFATCAEMILQGSQSDIHEGCIFECSKNNSTRVTEISQGEFVVTNARIIDFYCDGAEVKSYKVDVNIGAIKIQVNCSCRVLINRESGFLEPGFPCARSNGRNEDILQIVPSQMSKLKGIVFEDSSVKYTKTSDVVDQEWFYKLPVLNVTAPAKYKFSQDYKNAVLVDVVAQSSWLTSVWLFLLTAYIFILSVYFCQTGSCGNRKWSPVSMLMCLSPGVCGDENGSGVPISGKVADIMWEVMKNYEITNIVVIGVGCIIGFILIIVIWKIFRFVRGTYRISQQLLTSVEIPEMRRR